MSVSGDSSEHGSWDFAGTMDFTANATCTAVNEVNAKGKVKFTLEQATKFQSGRRGIALLFL